ncbi:MAG: hypothetical protein MI974_01810 [Chitinophagales bacterium]|nr:hypothetical protein [Chitinophagales bacterium]
MLIQRFFLLSLLSICWFNIASTQTVSSIFDEMYRDKVLQVTLETKLTQLIEDRTSDEYQPAVFTFTNASGEEEIHEIKIKSRGKFRRKVCQFPPVKLNFSKKKLATYGYLKDYDKLKLVTHCLNADNVSKQLVSKEYLAYKMYNQLTEHSYRTQIIAITYKDSEGLVRDIKRYGFILEDTDEMAQRAGGQECEECLNLSAANIDTPTENIMSVFQYMIGNEDWNTMMTRNIKMVKLEGQDISIPVPYDFDFSGMVDAPYAIPNTDYNLLDIKQRIFLGNKVSEDTLVNTLRLFVDKKEELYSLIKEFKLLNKIERKKAINYLETFYWEVEPYVNREELLPMSLVESMLINGTSQLEIETAKK